MNNYDYILFDLDGTLTDSGEGIKNSISFAFRQLGLDELSDSELRKFIGPPFRQAMMEFLGFSEKEAAEAIGIYRQRYASTGIFECEVYSGIPTLLESLRSNGKTLAVATSKPEVYSLRIAAHFGFDKYFDSITGSELDGVRDNKDEVIALALSRLGCKDLSRALMIGDRKYDVLGARKNGIDCVGVLYGYGSREELELAGAAKIAASVSELAAMLGV